MTANIRQEKNRFMAGILVKGKLLKISLPSPFQLKGLYFLHANQTPAGFSDTGRIQTPSGPSDTAGSVCY
jgi:hypothetical protein